MNRLAAVAAIAAWLFGCAAAPPLPPAKPATAPPAAYPAPRPPAVSTAPQPPLDDSMPVLVGTVLNVTDGDTIKVQLSSGPISVRLYSIDAPENDQPWGPEARAAGWRPPR